MMRTMYARGALYTLFAVLLALLARPAAAALPEFTGLVERNRAAVVNISTVQKMSHKRIPHMQIPELPEDSPFGDLFRRFFGEGGDGEMPEFDARSLRPT